MTKFVFITMLLVNLSGSAIATELGRQVPLAYEKTTGVNDAVVEKSDCCWDKVDFERWSQVPYTAAQGPDCCWVPVWGDTGR